MFVNHCSVRRTSGKLIHELCAGDCVRRCSPVCGLLLFPIRLRGRWSDIGLGGGTFLSLFQKVGA